MNNKLTAVLLLSCPDKIGLVSKLSNFIFEKGGNIIDLDEHVDPEERLFSIRIAWDMENFSIPKGKLVETFTPIAEELEATWEIKFLEEKMKVALYVSKYDHCLHELLWRYKMGEFSIEIPLIISNHGELEGLANLYEIPFYTFPKNKENKIVQEEKELKLLEVHKVNSIVLARYMQILSPEFINRYQNKIINIHHSFLPAFVGSNPYKQAFERGVKIIGATSHFVTKELDDGPIIYQDVIHISHKDTLKDLIRKGRDLERMVLSRALLFYFEHRVLLNGRKTIVFE